MMFLMSADILFLLRKQSVTIKGMKIAVTICEDIWNDKDYFKGGLQDPGFFSRIGTDQYCFSLRSGGERGKDAPGSLKISVIFI